jgi:DNA polymerase, archaea type
MRGTWIVDSSHRGYVELWSMGGRLEAKPYHPRIYLHMPDPHRYREMLEELESRFSAEECTFKTIYGQKSGYSIMAQRKTIEAIEIQTMFSVEFYNVDLRADQRYMAEKGIFPCGFDDESRFQADFEMPISVLEMSIPGDPGRSPQVIKADIAGKRLEGNEREVREDLLGLVKVHNPDVILFPEADGWMQVIASRAQEAWAGDGDGRRF